MGRPLKITDEEKQDVVNYMIQDPLQNLNDISEHFNFAPSTIKDILNQNKIQIF